jgi:hypothetical protein
MARKNRLFAKLASDVDTSGNIIQSGLADGVGGAGVTVYDSTGALGYSGNDNGDQAYVKSNNRLYIWDSVGWYNVALINNAPNITSVTDTSDNSTPFTLATDGSTQTIITIVAADSDGDPLTYTFTKGTGFDSIATVSQDSSVFTITPLSQDSAGAAESGTLTFKVSDGINTSSSISTFNLVFDTGFIRFTDAFMQTITTNSNYTIPGSASATLSDTPGTAYPSITNGLISAGGTNYGNHYWFEETANHNHTKGVEINQHPWYTRSTGSIEFWIRYSGTYNAREYVFGDKYMGTGGSVYGITWLRDNTTNASIYVGGVSAGNEQTSTLTNNTWYHAYFAKSGTNVWLYLNGSLESSWNVSENTNPGNKIRFFNNASASAGAAIRIAGINISDNNTLLYATTGGSTISGIEYPT